MSKKNLVIFLVILIFGCSNQKNNKATILKNEEAILVEVNELINNLDDKKDYKEVNIFSEIDVRKGRDQGARFFKTDDVDLIQVFRFASLHKEEIYLFLISDSFYHITKKQFIYNVPYYMDSARIVDTIGSEFFLNNNQLVDYQINGKRMELTDEILKEFSEYEELVSRYNKRYGSASN